MYPIDILYARVDSTYIREARKGNEMTVKTIQGTSGQEIAIEAKVRKHRFAGSDPSHCERCDRQFSSIVHK
jgi:hypothetical protein